VVPTALTPSGYRKRVRGANAPVTDISAAHPGQDQAAPEPTGTAKAEATRDLLGGLHAGVERGRAEIVRTGLAGTPVDGRGPTPPDHRPAAPEEGR
jgi:hypothetical protein